jgi:hypothetical protein
MIRIVARPAGLALVAALVVACGGGTPGTPTGTPPGLGTPVPGTSEGVPATIPAACTLLTDGDVTELTGLTVVSRADDVADTVYANHCRLTIQRSDGGSGTLDVGILSPGGRERYDHSGGNAGLEPIDGLPADDAGRDTNVGGIFAVRGDTLVDVYTLSLRLDAETEVEVVRRVLERLAGSTAPAGTPAAGASNGDPAGDPCALLTDADIQEVTGYAAVSHAIQPTGGLWDTSCVWQVAGSSAVPATVTVTIKSPGGRANWDQYMVPIQGEFSAVPGLGDAAFEKVHWPTHVLVGDAYLSVQFRDSPDPEGPISTDLARRVVESLGG